MNPLLSEKVVARAFERDAAVASAEYGGEFRTDVETFISAPMLSTPPLCQIALNCPAFRACVMSPSSILPAVPAATR